MYFICLIAHARLAVGPCAAQMSHDPPTFPRCHQQMVKSPRHCLWICPYYQVVWRLVYLLLSRIGTPNGFVTWGAVSWLLQFPGSHLLFEGEDSDSVYMITGITYFSSMMGMIPATVRDTEIHTREPIFAIVASISIWCIWKCRCMHVLSDEPSTVTQIICMIWTELIYTLRSQWDASAGSWRAVECRHTEFLRHWGQTSMFFRRIPGDVTWHYAPPKWFLLHSSHQPP